MRIDNDAFFMCFFFFVIQRYQFFYYGKYKKKDAIKRLFLLTHQGSNLNSAEPKSDVLPVTPWVKNSSANIDVFLKY